DWLGHGIYFWEDSYLRALRWAEEESKKSHRKIDLPAVIGATIELGNCLNLTSRVPRVGSHSDLRSIAEADYWLFSAANGSVERFLFSFFGGFEDEEAAACFAPDSQKRSLIFVLVHRVQGLLGISHFLMVDLKDDVTGTQSLFGCGRIRRDIGDDCAPHVIWDIELTM